MTFYTVKSEGLAHNSYFLCDGNEAVVVDPRRDCKVYLRLAKKTCTKIRYILETHRNEDYIVGSRELRNLTGADIAHSKELSFKYGQHNLDDGEKLTVGNLRIKALLTPGHTNESLSYTVSNPQKSSSSFMVFTGDTLFVGSVGRTDLQGKESQPEQAEKLYTSLHEKLLPLGSHVAVYPAHSAGSLCGSEISKQKISTIGYEKKTNPYLKLNKQAFIECVVAQEMLIPPYFRKMEEYNLNGAPPLRGLRKPIAMCVSEFEAEMNENDSLVIDTRLPNAFAGSHIPNSLNIWMGGTSVYPGWLVDYSQRVLLVTEREADVRRVSKHLWRLGFDNLYGFLCENISEWENQGKPLSNLRTLSVTELKESLSRYAVLDVREPCEWKNGYIEGAERIFFGNLEQQAERIERNRRIALICSDGKRSSIAVSILQRKGFIHVTNITGGMNAWKNLNYPTKNE